MTRAFLQSWEILNWATCETTLRAQVIILTVDIATKLARGINKSTTIQSVTGLFEENQNLSEFMFHKSVKPEAAQGPPEMIIF